MNYEDLYADYLLKEKELRDQIAEQQKCFKRIIKEMENGDIKNALKDMSALNETARSLEQLSGDMLDLTQNFDANSYITSGDFAEQMLSYCKEFGVDAIGENNNYEMFPYRIKLDGENAEVFLDRRKLPYLRPQSLVKFIKTQIDKIMGSSFDPGVFLNELAQAYDLALTVQAKDKKRAVAPDADVHLNTLYRHLTPMRRFRRDYNMQSFAFDIARLYSSGIEKANDGRSYQFGPSRTNDKPIRVLDKYSQERLLATIRFFEPEEERTEEGEK
jgi:predicted oxidoreductase